MSRLWLDPQSEDSLLTEVAARRQRLAAMTRQVSPMTGMVADAYADAYPWMEAGATQSFLQAGVMPDDPRVQAAASVAAEDISEPADDVADSWWETLLNSAVLNPARSLARGAFTLVSAPIEEAQALISSFGEAAAAGEDEYGSGGGFSFSELIADLGDLPEDLGRFWDNYTTKAARSGLGLAIGRALRGEDLGLGTGWLPGGAVYAQRERDKMRLQLDGEFVTPGRLIARDITEPGTGMYQFVSGASDFALNLWGDPGNAALKGLSAAQKANRSFQAYGLIGAARKTVAPQRVDDYLRSDLGRRLTTWLTEQSDVRQVWEATGRADLGLARRIAETRDETAMAELLSRTLGTVVREKPTAGFLSRQVGRVGGDYGRLFGGGAVVRRSLNARNVRLFSEMPGSQISFRSAAATAKAAAEETGAGLLATAKETVRLVNESPTATLNLFDANGAAKELEAWMRNAKMGDDAVSRHLGRLAEIGDTPTGILTVAKEVMTDANGILVNEWGLTTGQARRITKMYDDYSSAHRAYDFDDLGRHVDVLAPLRVAVDGKVMDAAPTAGIIADLIGSSFALPDARELRRATPTVRRLQSLYRSGLWKGSIDAMDAVMSTVWKPLQLLRGAYTVRVIGEEQVRLAAAGYDSLANHPLRAISWMLGVDPKSKLGQRLAAEFGDAWDSMAKLRQAIGEADDAVGRGGVSLLGERFDDAAFIEHTDAMSRGAAGHAGLPGEVATGRYVRAQYGDDGFHQAWADRLAHIGNDAVMQRLAGGLTAADIKSIRKVRPDWSPSGSDFDNVMDWFWWGSGAKFRKRLAVAIEDSGLSTRLLNDRDAARAYLRQNFQGQLDRLTGRNPELVSLIGTGKLGDDIDIRRLGANRRLARRLEAEFDDAHPNYVPMEDTLRMSTPGSRTTQRLNNAVDRLFNALMSQPTNYLSRSPAFRQMYYQRVTELIDFAPRELQEAMVRAAGEANVPRHILEQMASRMLKGAGDRIGSLEDVDVLAKAFALDGTKKLLYDLSKRSQFFDITRLIFPFGEAWKEIITTWGRLIRENPQIARRGQQAIHGARGGDQDDSTGWFHVDPVTGEEVFSYPDFGLSKWLLGTDLARVTPVGRAAGLNVVSATVLPGFGPVIQLPVQNLLPPRFEEIHKLVSPFGDQPGDTLGEQISASFTPAWLEKVKTAVFADPSKDRLFANTVMDVMRALHRSGDYPIGSVEDMQRLTDDARAKARLLYFIRGIAQSAVPTGPSFQWDTADVEGNLVPVKLLSDELRRMTDEEYGGDRNAAFLEWTKRFGVDNVLAIQAKSQELVERPVTAEGDRWLRDHPDLERTYDQVIGFFAPEPAVGEFDYDAYLRQFDTGARQGLTPDEMVALANDFLGRVEYEQAKKVAAMRPGPQSAAWLAQLRDDIAQRRPGFDGWVPARVRAQRPQVDQQIAQMRAAVTDPTLAGTDVGRGTIKYLSALDVAEKMTAALPGDVRAYQSAKAAAPIRAFLRDAAADIIAEHPDFARVWYGIFERELAEDEGVLGG